MVDSPSPLSLMLTEVLEDIFDKSVIAAKNKNTLVQQKKLLKQSLDKYWRCSLGFLFD
jgi:hypothetical protein